MSTKCERYTGEDWRVFTDYDSPDEVTVEWTTPWEGCTNCGHGAGGHSTHSVEIPVRVWRQMQHAMRQATPQNWEVK